MKRISLDIETLDTACSGVILSIGACVVTKQDGVDEVNTFYERLPIQEQLDEGRTISADTLRWWMSQPADVLASAFGTSDDDDVVSVLTRLAEWLRYHDERVYVKGPAFDAAMMQDIFNQFNVDMPVHFRKWLDLRTLSDVIELADDNGLEFAWWSVQQDSMGDGFAHDALDDAICQGRQIAWFMQNVNL